MAFELASLIVKLVANDSQLTAALERARAKLEALNLGVEGLGEQTLRLQGVGEISAQIEQLGQKLGGLSLPSGLFDLLDRARQSLINLAGALQGTGADTPLASLQSNVSLLSQNLDLLSQKKVTEVVAPEATPPVLNLSTSLSTLSTMLPAVAIQLDQVNESLRLPALTGLPEMIGSVQIAFAQITGPPASLGTETQNAADAVTNLGVQSTGATSMIQDAAAAMYGFGAQVAQTATELVLPDLTPMVSQLDTVGQVTNSTMTEVAQDVYSAAIVVSTLNDTLAQGVGAVGDLGAQADAVNPMLELPGAREATDAIEELVGVVNSFVGIDPSVANSIEDVLPVVDVVRDGVLDLDDAVSTVGDHLGELSDKFKANTSDAGAGGGGDIKGVDSVKEKFNEVKLSPDLLADVRDLNVGLESTDEVLIRLRQDAAYWEEELRKAKAAGRPGTEMEEMAAALAKVKEAMGSMQGIPPEAVQNTLAMIDNVRDMGRSLDDTKVKFRETYSATELVKRGFEGMAAGANAMGNMVMGVLRTLINQARQLTLQLLGISSIRMTPAGIMPASVQMQELSMHTGTLVQRLASLAGIDVSTLLQFGTIGGGIAAIGMLTKRYMDLDDEQKMLSARMQSLGFDVDTAIPKWRQFTQQLADTGTMSMQTAKELTSMAIMRGPERMRQDYDKLVLAAQAFAAKTGMPVQNMLRMVMFGEENYRNYQRVLKMAGEQVRAGASQAEIMAKVNKIIKEGSGMLAMQQTTFKATFQQMSNSVSALTGAFAKASAGALADSLRMLVQRISESLKSMTAWVNAHKEVIGQISVTVTKVIVAVGAFKVLQLMFNSLTSQGGILRTALTGMLGPLGLLGAAFLALRPMLMGIWDGGADGIAKFGKQAIGAVAGFAKDLVAGMRGFGAAVMDAIRPALTLLGNALMGILTQFGVTLGSLRGNMAAWGAQIGTIVGSALRSVLTVITQIVEAIKPWAPQILAVLGAFLAMRPALGLLQTLIAPIGLVIGTLLSPIGLVMGALGGLFAMLVSAKGSIGGAFNSIINTISMVVRNVRDFALAMWQAVGPGIIAVAGVVAGILKDIVSAIFGAGDASSSWGQTIANVIGPPLKLILSVIQTVLEFIRPIAPMLAAAAIGAWALGGALGAAGSAVSFLGLGIGSLLGPIGMVIGAIAGIGTAFEDPQHEARTFAEGLGEAARFIKGWTWDPVKQAFEDSVHLLTEEEIAAKKMAEDEKKRKLEAEQAQEAKKREIEWQKRMSDMQAKSNADAKKQQEELKKAGAKAAEDAKKQFDFKLEGGRPQGGGFMDLQAMWKKLQEQAAGGSEFGDMNNTLKKQLTQQENSNKTLGEIRDGIQGGQPAGFVPPAF